MALPSYKSYIGRSSSKASTPSASNGPTTDQLLELLRQQYQPKEKVGMLGRILAPITGIGSGLDAYYDARFEDKDAGILNILKNYGKNLAQGVGTLVTGTKYEDTQELSDILDKSNPSWKRSGFGKNPWGRAAVDIAGGLVTDPLTWTGFKGVKVADDLAKSALKGIAGASDDIARKITGETLENATKIVSREVSEEAGNAFLKNATKIGGKGIKSGRATFLGKTVTQNPKIVKGMKALSNPLGEGMSALGAGAEKYTPGLYQAATDASADFRTGVKGFFNPTGLAESLGKTDLGTSLRNFQRKFSSAGRSSAKDIADAGLLESWKKLDLEQKTGLGKLIQGSERLTDETIEDVINTFGKGPIDSAFKQTNKIDTPIKDFLKKYQTFQEKQTSTLGGLGFDVIDNGKYIHQKVSGFKKNFLDKYFKNEMTPEQYQDFITSPKIAKQLKKGDGVVSRDAIRSFLKTDADRILSKFEPSDLMSAVSGKGSQNKRMFENIVAGEAAGVVYDDNWMKTIYEQTERQSQQIAGKQFADELVGMVDDNGQKLFMGKPSAGFSVKVKIPGVKEGAEGAEMYTDAATAKIAENVFSKFRSPSDIDKMLKPLDDLMGQWKGYVTGFGPRVVTYQMRNAVDDALRMITDGHNPLNLTKNWGMAKTLTDFDAIATEVGFEKAYKEMDSKSISKIDDFLRGVGKEPGENSLKQLWQTVVDKGVYSDSGQMGAEAGMSVGIKELLGEKMGLMDTAKDIAGGKGAFANREQQGRIAHFLEMWNQTGSSEEAAERVRKTLFNYDELTTGERAIAARAMPFYSFAKNNINFYLSTLKNNPERLAKYKNFIDGLESGTQGAFGEDWENMPDYMKETTTLPFAKDGDTLKTIGNLGLSIEGLNDLAPKNMASNLNPLLKMGIEGVTGKNLFYDKDIMDMNEGGAYSKYPQAIKDLLNYNEYQVGEGDEAFTRSTVAPGAKYALENMPFLSSSLSFLNKPLTKKFIPVKIGEQNVKSAKNKKEQAKNDALYELLQSKGMADTYSRYYIPAGLREKLWSQQQ